jgi:putative glycosyltransferase (TIGR04372 family)
VIPIEKFNITNSLQLSPLVENLEIIKAKDYYLDIYELMESFCLRLRESSVERRTRISAEILASMNEYWHSSREKLSQLDLAPGVPFVVLHVREIRNRKDIRNASILNYFDAIQYVLDAGFKVVRIGSAESSLPHRAPPGLIDLGGLPEANCLLLYLLIECKAFIGTSSGPNVLAQMLGTPSLLTNMTSLARNTFSFPYTLYLPKVVSTNGKIAGIENYYSSRNAFGEMTDSSLARIGMNIRENTKKEILDATRDLLIGLEGDLTHSKDTDRNSMRHRLLDLGSLTTGNLAPSFLESHLN